MIEVDPQQRAFETTLAAQRRHNGLEKAAGLALPQITVEDRLSIEAALAGHRNGLDLADALHRATYRSCDRMASYDDRGFVRPPPTARPPARPHHCPGMSAPPPSTQAVLPAATAAAWPRCRREAHILKDVLLLLGAGAPSVLVRTTEASTRGENSCPQAACRKTMTRRCNVSSSSRSRLRMGSILLARTWP